MLAIQDGAVATSRHKCLIYDGHPSEQLPVIVPLLKDGLESNYRCLYLGAPQIIAMVQAGLGRRGVDTVAESRRGALVFSSDRGHLATGTFDPQAMVDGLRGMIDDAVRDGFAGLCATGDMRWELGDDDRNFDRLLEYEALLEQVFRDRPLMGICQYHRDVLPARTVRDALLTHRATFIGDTLNRDNLFYIPPELALESRTSLDPAKHGDWMFQQIARVLNAEAARDRALTALQASEARLAEANRDLERRVHERTAELETANAHLESFSHSVSHDLRAPIRAVKGFAEILAEEFSASLGPDGQDYVNRMTRSARRMEEMVDGMMVLAGAMKLPMARATVDLTGLAHEVAAELRETAPPRNVEFIVDENLTAVGDRALIRVAFVNLIGNAWKFSAKRERARVEIRRHGSEDAMTTFFIRDNGAGFEASQATRLFEVFQRMHSQQEFDGTGVGLATVQRVIQRHGGRIWADSAPESGATFYFTLPA